MAIITTTNDLLLSIERIRKPACFYVALSARSQGYTHYRPRGENNASRKRLQKVVAQYPHVVSSVYGEASCILRLSYGRVCQSIFDFEKGEKGRREGASEKPKGRRGQMWVGPLTDFLRERRGATRENRSY